MRRLTVAAVLGLFAISASAEAGCFAKRQAAMGGSCYSSQSYGFFKQKTKYKGAYSALPSCAPAPTFSSVVPTPQYAAPVPLPAAPVPSKQVPAPVSFVPALYERTPDYQLWPEPESLPIATLLPAANGVTYLVTFIR